MVVSSEDRRLLLCRWSLLGSGVGASVCGAAGLSGCNVRVRTPVWTPSPSGHLLSPSLLFTPWWDGGCLRKLIFPPLSPRVLILAASGA